MWPQLGDTEKLPTYNHFMLFYAEKFLEGGVLRAYGSKISRPAAANPMGQGVQFKIGEGHSAIFLSP